MFCADQRRFGNDQVVVGFPGPNGYDIIAFYGSSNNDKEEEAAPSLDVGGELLGFVGAFCELQSFALVGFSWQGLRRPCSTASYYRA